MPGNGGGGGGGGGVGGGGSQPGGQGYAGGQQHAQVPGSAGSTPPLIACPSCSMRLQPPPVGSEGDGKPRGATGGKAAAR